MGKHGGMYGTQWHKARIAFLREHPFCTMCGKALRGADAAVDHTRPDGRRTPEHGAELSAVFRGYGRGRWGGTARCG